MKDIILFQSHWVGNNEKDNLVNLTYREHYIAHWLLTKIYPGKKMWYAFWIMNCCQNDIYVNSNAYNRMRLECKQINSESHKGQKSWNKGQKMSEEFRKKISITTKEAMKYVDKNKLASYGMLGKKHSSETKLKMSASSSGKNTQAYGKRWYTNGKDYILVYPEKKPEGYVLGARKHSDETKKKISNTLKLSNKNK